METPPCQYAATPSFRDVAENAKTRFAMFYKDPLPQHQTVAVFGLGGSGLAAINLLSAFNKKIIASDTADESKRAEFEAKLPAGTQLVLGSNEIGDATIIVTSPGLEPSSEIFQLAAQKNVPVLAELDLGALATNTPLVAITGTDGKTTTTTLTSHLLNTCGVKNLMGGNVGIPLCTSVCDENKQDCFVVETSAFQLSFCPNFRPKVLIATNIAEDHAEYFHNDWNTYVTTKRRPLNVMDENDVVILNASDEYMSKWDRYTSSRVVWYAAKQADLPTNAVDRAWFDGKVMTFCFDGVTHELPLERTHLKGNHNAMNVMGAVLTSLVMGCAWDAIVNAFDSYKLPPHRIQTVRTLNGVTFIDDSKATNPHAAIAGLTTINEPLVLIAGGVDKGLSLTEWIELMKTNVRALVLIGALTERLHKECLEQHLQCPIIRCKTLEDAVKVSYDQARDLNASVVLLSPACSSYDMFKSYGQRGDMFAAAANALN